MPTFGSLDEYVQFLDNHDELIRVDGADREGEIGALTEIAVHNRPAPTLLFDNVDGYESGFRVLSNAVTAPFQWTAAMGFEPTRSKREAAALARKNSSVSNLIPPNEVSDGPVMENVDRGSDVDVTKFPTPVWHERDGGPYIGTGDVVVTKNAETGEFNAGTYRIQVHGPETITVYTVPGKDGQLNVQSFLDRGEPAPIVASVGQPVDLFLSACERTASNVNELEYMGGRRGEPIDVIPGEATGLPMPVQSEIILEGYIDPDADTVTEGPFGEWTGYYASGEEELLPMTVERVYHRDDPIILGKPPIRPPAHVLAEIKSMVRLWDEFESSGIPGIVDINTMSFGPGWFEVIAIDPQYPGHARQVGHHAASGVEGGYFARFKVVVDDDIDVFDLEEVMWAIVSRVNPATDIQFLEGCWNSPLDPRIHPDQKADGDITGSQAIIDATRPYHWRDDFPPVNEISDEVKAQVFEDWEDVVTQLVE